jgi:diguanylate cyclase (GGDEF)-like protein
MHELWTNQHTVRRIAVVTSIAVSMSLVITLPAMIYVFGLDPDATIKVSLAFKFGIAIAVVAPALVCPATSYKIAMTIRERDRAHTELRRLADTDQLTGLLNRRGFDAAVKSVGLPNSPMSALMIDIDNFKKLNDNLGHDFGDAALVQVAAILRNTAKAEGFVVSRQGGEEFIALLPGVSGAEAVTIAEKLREACSSTPVEFEQKSAHVAVSIGVSTRRQQSSLSHLFGEADSALYRAKQTGRNRVVLHQPVISLVRVA